MSHEGHQHPMMACEELTELVTDYLEHRLSLWQSIRFQFHLGLCGACREYLSQMEKVRDALGALERPPIPDAVKAEMAKRFRGWKAGGGGVKGPGSGSGSKL